jgi:hypothetical protein
MMRLWALNKLAELRIGKGKVRACHIDQVAQTSNDAAIAKVEDFVWHNDGVAHF